MFTGLIQAKGVLLRRTPHGKDARLVIQGELVVKGPVNGLSSSDPIVLGESIAGDGVCLTVDRIVEAGGPGATVFEADASSETLSLTTLGALSTGAAVNLERAMPLGGRLGGHIVSGHVDGVGKVVRLEPVSGALKVTVEVPNDLARYVAPKGSICISGVSLTVNHVHGNQFDVMLIPHTREKTSLDALAAGSHVNLEVDVLARYVARLLEAGRPTEEASPDSHLLERLRASGYV